MGRLQKLPIIISIILLLLAIPSGWPYGYYTLLRFAVCGTSVYMTLFALEHQKKIWIWASGFVALLFNPLILIHLDKETWVVFDFVAALFMLVAIFKLKETKTNK